AGAAVVVVHDRHGAEQRAVLHRVEPGEEPQLRGGPPAARRPTRQPGPGYALLRPGDVRSHDDVLMLWERSDFDSRRRRIRPGSVKSLTTDTGLAGSSSR